MLLPDTRQFQSATALQLAIYVFAPRLLNQLFFFLTASCFAFFFPHSKKKQTLPLLFHSLPKPPQIFNHIICQKFLYQTISFLGLVHSPAEISF